MWVYVVTAIGGIVLGGVVVYLGVMYWLSKAFRR